MTHEEEFAQIYVACALTNVDERSRRTLQKDCAAIVDATQEVANQELWRVVAYDPITHTPPWVAKGKAFSSEEVWLIDTTKVLEEADAVIVHGFQGGSTGVGIELALAFGRGIPVLYVHHDTCEVTRMVKGMPALVEVKPFFDHGDDGTHELRRIVREWLIKWRPVIAEGPANRRSLVDLFGPTQRSLPGLTEIAGTRRSRK